MCYNDLLPEARGHDVSANNRRKIVSEPYFSDNLDSIRTARRDSHGMVTLAVIPLVDQVIYPDIITLLNIEDTRGAEAARAALRDRRTVIGLAQRDLEISEPQAKDLYPVGTEIAIVRGPTAFEAGVQVLAQGRRRVRISEVVQNDPYIIVKAFVLEDDTTQTDETLVLARTVVDMFSQVSEMGDLMNESMMDYASGLAERAEDVGLLADFVASNLSLSIEERQMVLEQNDVSLRLREVASLLNREMKLLELREEISGQIQTEMAKNQREAYLREQVRVIQNELAQGDPFQQDVLEVRQQLAEASLPAEIRERAEKELSRLAAMPPMAPEFGIIRTYLDWIIGLPWSQASEDNLDLRNAQKVLNEDHYGLDKIKDRILEHIAVHQLAGDDMKSPILCFVGPPGVGKTSLGRSIARALGRTFVRVSLGGLRDEAEIRGHRRTYIGALPGRILQTMKRAGTINPVFMLDEIDKLGADFRGDPSAALLEVLDPEQNHEYSDHYLDLPYNLSKVMFITTANDLSTLQEALLDRLEIIEFPGYTEEEKVAIAEQYLIPEQIKANGIASAGIRFNSESLLALIREYTYEAGVRNLNREIGNVCRKVARALAESRKPTKRITVEQVHKMLGPPEFLETHLNREDTVGLATGLAWTAGGGDTLSFEVSVLPGKGTLMMTGSLGEVMQESAQAALSYMRSRADFFNVPHDDFEDFDVHVHVPEGAVPKDGPSAGITLATAIISAFTERKVRANFAMTGELTLRGRVLGIGGLKEKILAAVRAKITDVIIPQQNAKDLDDLPPKTQQKIKIHVVEDMQQVVDLMLLPPPEGGRERDKDVKQEPAKTPRKKKAATPEPEKAATPTKRRSSKSTPENEA